MANYIITRSREIFEKIGSYNYCNLEDMILPDKIAVDSETTDLYVHLGAYMFCMQIGTGKNNYIIDLERRDTPLLTGKQIFFKELQPYLESKTLVFHNAAFDLRFIYSEGFYPEEVRDTMIASRALYNGKDGIYSHSFDAVMKREMNIVYDKSEQKTINKIRLTTDRNIKYSFDDVDRLLELENILIRKLNSENAHVNYFFQCKFIKTQAYLENCGLPVSSSKWRNKCDNDLLEKKKIEEKIKEYIFDNLPQFRINQLDLFGTFKNVSVNLDSPKQMINVFKGFGIDVYDKKKDTESISEAIIGRSSHEFVKMWLTYQEHNHNVSTFGYNLLEQILNERIYSTFNILADTGRMISRKGSINFLNFPATTSTRECFVAPKGHKVIGCDYDSMESRILAYESQDENSKLNVLLNRDAHSLLAREAFDYLKGLTDKEIKANYNNERQIGKVINFAASFGATGFTIATQLGLPLSEGDRLYSVYKQLYKDVFTWGEGIYKEAIKVGYIPSVYGFRKYLPGFDLFNELGLKIEDLNWDIYKQGKAEYKKEKEALEKEEVYISKYVADISYYKEKFKIVSKYFSMKAGYFNLCLNFPIQSKASFMTKLAGIQLLKEIKKNKHLEIVKISNIIYD